MALIVETMKRRLTYILCLSLVVAISGCDKADSDNNPETPVTPPASQPETPPSTQPDTPPAPETLKDKICGEWHYSADNGIDIRIALNSDETYELYQKFEGGVHHLYRGTWTLNDDILSGSYNDNVVWQTSYSITISEDKATLTLHNTSDLSDTQIYLRESIPDSIKETCIIEVKSNPLS